ncbi:radical SAM protein [Streptomyces sp. NBC_01622]|uniref:radical SAM protein n=1 Tax=Streptomyces sp. NBC_01622 TaxID=2975903 RepID=UPI0038663A61|nr:radical SAM protein [Streptomyces sp. NBC_01622]
MDFRPIGRCNLSCPFCFGPRHETPTMRREEAFRIAATLRQEGVQGVVISGGEPTLLPYLGDLVEELSSPLPDGGSPPKVVLSTNGLASLRVMQRILPGLSWIALPLESADDKEHRELRKGVAPHREKVLDLLREVRKNYETVGVKLGTVVTRRNVTGAPRVLDLIEQSWLPDVWKVYQMSETNYGADNGDWLSVGDDEFEEVVARCQEAADERKVTLRVYRNSTRTGSYFFIDPDAEVVVIDDGEERRLGNFFDLLQDDGVRPSSLVQPSRNIANFVGTYPDH